MALSLKISLMGNYTALRMGRKEQRTSLGLKLKARLSVKDGRRGVSMGRHGLGRDYAGIGPLDGYSSGEKKFKNNSINSGSSIRRARTEGPQIMTKNMEDAFLNSTMSSMQSKVDFK